MDADDIECCECHTRTRRACIYRRCQACCEIYIHTSANNVDGQQCPYHSQSSFIIDDITTLVGRTFNGIVDGSFEHGHFITVVSGNVTLKGMIFNSECAVKVFPLQDQPLSTNVPLPLPPLPPLISSTTATTMNPSIPSNKQQRQQLHQHDHNENAIDDNHHDDDAGHDTRGNGISMSNTMISSSSSPNVSASMSSSSSPSLSSISHVLPTSSFNGLSGAVRDASANITAVPLLPYPQSQQLTIGHGHGGYHHHSSSSVSSSSQSSAASLAASAFASVSTSSTSSMTSSVSPQLPTRVRSYIKSGKYKRARSDDTTDVSTATMIDPISSSSSSPLASGTNTNTNINPNTNDNNTNGKGGSDTNIALSSVIVIADNDERHNDDGDHDTVSNVATVKHEPPVLSTSIASVVTSTNALSGEDAGLAYYLTEQLALARGDHHSIRQRWATLSVSTRQAFIQLASLRAQSTAARSARHRSRRN